MIPPLDNSPRVREFETVGEILARPDWAWVSMAEAARVLGYAEGDVADPGLAARRWLEGRARLETVRVGNHWCVRRDRLVAALQEANHA
ncbi:MAG TPA: hypothetical protein VMW52_06565 [Phycisphaerae bacterium]|nr:hypothetical protein [Phycisphaerae bacterium]